MDNYKLAVYYQPRVTYSSSVERPSVLVHDDFLTSNVYRKNVDAPQSEYHKWKESELKTPSRNELIANLQANSIPVMHLHKLCQIFKFARAARRYYRHMGFTQMKDMVAYTRDRKHISAAQLSKYYPRDILYYYNATSLHTITKRYKGHTIRRIDRSHMNANEFIDAIDKYAEYMFTKHELADLKKKASEVTIDIFDRNSIDSDSELYDGSRWVEKKDPSAATKQPNEEKRPLMPVGTFIDGLLDISLRDRSDGAVTVAEWNRICKTVNKQSFHLARQMAANIYNKFYTANMGFITLPDVELANIIYNIICRGYAVYLFVAEDPNYALYLYDEQQPIIDRFLTEVNLDELFMRNIEPDWQLFSA